MKADFAKFWQIALGLVLVAGLTLAPGDKQKGAKPSSQAAIETAALPASAGPNQTPAPIPSSPPDASLISVGAPDVDGYAAVTGSAGAVPGQAVLAIVNLSGGNLITTTATTAGAFSATLFAPPGSDVLVKYDTQSPRIDQLWQEATGGGANDVTYINLLPGTMIRAGQVTPGSGEFQSAGYFGEFEGPPWAGWWLSGTVSGPGGAGDLDLQPGDAVSISGTLRVTSSALNCSGTPTFSPTVDLDLHYLFDAQGQSHPWVAGFVSHLFTPTGLPIEHEASGESRALGNAPITNLTCLSQDTAQGTLAINTSVPANLPAGTYRLETRINDGGVPTSSDTPRALIWYHLDPIARLPPLTVSAPASPRIPWTLLGNELSNGHRGVVAQEEAGHFAMLTRIVYPPETTVLPMLDERSGLPLTYRLEPGSPWLSSTDRRMPSPLYIPLSLPGGELTIGVQKPDGKTDTLGPAPLLQSSVRTPTTPGGSAIDVGTGHVGDIYHLYRDDDAFAYSFDQYGVYTIVLGGVMQDVYGNVYPINATYDLMVARILDLDPAQLPTTPYEQGDAFAPGLHVFPPVPAEVTITLTHLPLSDPAQAITTTISGTANRFGYFQPPVGTELRLDTPGEFRVDIDATYQAPDETLWAGSMTWGNVVEGTNAQIAAHGRRGLDFEGNSILDTPTWFVVNNLPPDKLGMEVYYPFFSGDVHWGDETPGVSPGDSIQPVVTLSDLTGPETIYNLIRNHYPRSRNRFRPPPVDWSLNGLNDRLAMDEAPLFLTTASGIDPAVDPADIDLWGYWYGSSERPGVRVREIISEDGMGTGYWRFNDTYGYQIGVPANGDQPGDLKWEFGGVVFRVPGQGINEYGIYASLWVLLPHFDPVGARVTPPFQDATGASINGGPIMTLLGQEIDMLFLPKGVRPGDVLEVGDTVSFSGHVGPPLDSRVEATITAPSGTQRSRVWHANKIGWLYDPTFDFVADEAGRWTVEVFVEHDRPLAYASAPTSHNQGTVLGTSGQYEFYVVDPAAPRLFVFSPAPGFLTWPQGQVTPVTIRGAAPAGTTTVYYSIHDKGVVMGQGAVTPDSSGLFSLVYDAHALHADFPMLSLTAHEGVWEGLANEVAINFLALTPAGPQAATVTLIGEEVFLQGGAQGLSHLYLPSINR